ncbi:cytochrome P450 [Mycena rosella]|uniref:Cytochrome P450 n=1 Tax=Mycena rosella TaxID=1033263 RepID=A0AAD7CNX5_MYCRO|nr:cytochrome P450 [Mycena rosella]
MLSYSSPRRSADGALHSHLSQMPTEHVLQIDLNSIVGRTSLELIGHAGINYSFDAMLPGQEPTDRYAQSLRDALPTALKLMLLIPTLPTILKIPFPSFGRFMINFIPLLTLHYLRDRVDFNDAMAAQLVRDRKAAIQSGEMYVKDDAKDIMSLLIKSNIVADGGMHLTDEELVGATSTIISAATDTTSNALSRMFHTLALHPEMQAKLRTKILGAPEHPDYAALEALPYLDAFVREVLRLYPPVTPGMFRQTCEFRENAVLPLSKSIIGVDGIPMKAITVPKGTCIYIAITATNLYKQIWGADALEFKPERWANEKAESVTTKMCGIYGNTMTFLGGGRSCIGLKFAQLEMKAVACVMLHAFKFSNPDLCVKWRMTSIIPSPNVDNQPCLPILVERVSV